ncbi:LysM peptidoglycan-binding domain-containing protein [Aerococcaceae bacterium zg-ZJ1578]|uniref:LysM peptidoglycan-binding domain-containing protein n=1 Tax=Aerococcaceae bacterium zg-252 TaxID=2796928 RepID=UPI001A33B1F7|nr:LysM peptidoglycan-binding domain-containing protein [Aerococcaceae bacterium zg-1578]
MTMDNEKFGQEEVSERRERGNAPWNAKFGSDENLKQRQYSRSSRNQPNKEASSLSKVLLGVLIVTVITPFVLYWFVKSQTQSTPTTPQTASSIVLSRSTETTTVTSADSTTSGSFVQSNGNDNVNPVDVNASSATTTVQPVVETEAPVPVTEAPAPTRSHTVAAGETWYGIARTYGIDVNALAAANGTTIDSPLYPGNVLVIP